MAVAAPEIQARYPEVNTSAEVYARSLSSIRRLGQAALYVSIGPEQQSALTELVFDDFATAVTEMLRTDEEYKKHLDVNNRREHQIVDDKVRAGDGRTMVEILEETARFSSKLATSSEAYQGQSERDKCDVEIAKRADELEPGQTLWGISFVPAKDLKKYPELYDKELGYKEGLIYIQTYSKVDNMTLVAGSYSVDVSEDTDDSQVLRGILAKHGMAIPEDISDNAWPDHGQVVDASAEEADTQAREIRQEFYNAVGRQQEAYSITEYVKNQRGVVRQIFDTYYPALSEAVYSGNNNEALRSFAGSLLGEDIDLKPQYRRQLIKIANSPAFDDESGRDMDSIIRYAAAEELRKGLKGSKGEVINAHVFVPPGRIMMPVQIRNPFEFSLMMARNVKIGIEARRSYGGCPGNIELGNNEDSMLAKLLGLEEPSLQEAYAGLGKESVQKCVKCPLCKREGVDAHITYTKTEKTITCSKCKQSKTYKN